MLDLPQYSFKTDTEISNLDVGYAPTGVYIDGDQTYEYVLQGTTIYFNNMVPAGSTVTATPPDAIRVFNAETVTITIPNTGTCSVFTQPFGRMLFSSDGISWYKSLTRVYPATIYAKLTPHDLITDFKCRADFEVVVWSGEAAFVNEDGKVETQCADAGGLEYNVI